MLKLSAEREEKALMLLELYEKSDHVEFRIWNRKGNNTRAFAESFIEPYKKEDSYLFEFETEFGFLEVSNENHKISIGCRYTPKDAKKATNG